MIVYRPFCNTDPLQIAEIWHSRSDLRGLVPTMTPLIFENHVLSKPYFDRRGLIVASEEDRLLGFVHAGFGPLPDGSALDRSTGILCLLMVRPHAQSPVIRAQLIRLAEQYLCERGARLLQGGAATPHAPFYQGLYGGTVSPGVLAAHTEMLDALREAGYTRQVTRQLVRCRLDEFRPVVDRRLFAVRRASRVQVMIDPPAASWWDACTSGWIEQVRFAARARQDGAEWGQVTFCDIQPRPSEWDPYPIGMSQLTVGESADQDAVRLFLLGEALRQLRSERVALVDAHVSEQEGELADDLARLGFQPVDEGFVLVKEV